MWSFHFPTANCICYAIVKFILTSKNRTEDSDNHYKCRGTSSLLWNHICVVSHFYGWKLGGLWTKYVVKQWELVGESGKEGEIYCFLIQKNTWTWGPGEMATEQCACRVSMGIWVQISSTQVKARHGSGWLQSQHSGDRDNSRPSERTCLKKTNWRSSEEDTWFWPLVSLCTPTHVHMHCHICVCTRTHTHTRKVLAHISRRDI